MVVGDFVINETTTRDELIACIQDQQEEIGILESKIDAKDQEIEDLALAPEQLNRLAEAADLMANLGRIHDTPKAKADWIDGN